MTYSSPLEEPKEASGILDVYEAQRSNAGWQTIRRITPSGTQSVITNPGGISSDHRYAFVDVQTLNGSVPPLPSGSLAQTNTSAYLSKPDGSFEFIATGSLASEPYGQGRYISEGGQHIIFSTGLDPAQSEWCSRPGAECKVLRLEPDAPPTGTGAVYDREADGVTHVISLLPGDKTPAAGEQAFYQGVSKDGSVVAFKINGVLYVRIDNAETLEVAAGSPVFAGLSADGRYIYYVSEGSGEAGNIHRFDTETEADIQVNSSGDAELVNVSADGSHAYFISKSQLDGVKGTAGAPNLYVWSGTTSEYIATVAPSDLERTSGPAGKLPALTRWTSHAVASMRGPGADSSRTTPDGSMLIFESRAKLTGYENASHTEIYRYDDQGKSLACVSCNPRAEPATSDARLQELQLVDEQISVRNLTDDGRRIFFETSEALVERDTGGTNDIYEWQEEEGATSVDLISSGESSEFPPLLDAQYLPRPNTLLSVTPSGSDVVFLSQDALVSAAGIGGAPALYDARVNGGFAEPEAPKVCVEEECRLPVFSVPWLMSSLSETTTGAGNVKPRRHRHKPHCRRAGHKKHRHCRKKQTAHGAARIWSSLTQQLGGEGGATPNPESTSTSPNASVLGPQVTSPVTSAAGEFDEFGIKEVEASVSTSAAGMHPDFTTRFVLNHIPRKGNPPLVKGRIEDVSVSLPPGLLGNPKAFPRCRTGQLIAYGNCPIDSQVGIAKVFVDALSGPLTEPIYNMEVPHPDREVARLGFIGYQYPVYINVRVRTAGDYGVTATVEDAPALASLVEAKTTLWGNPPDPSHDEERLTAKEAGCPSGTACEAPEGKRSSSLPPTAFMSNPSTCQSGEVGFAVTSYQLPGQVFSANASLDPITGCAGLPFSPSFEATPTNRVAGAPTGLKTTFVLPQSSDPSTPATATLREALVSLPVGMQIAAGAANWIGTCSDEQVGYHQEVNAACPDASKLGTATITSPVLPEPLEGALYQRSPQPGRQFGLWLVTDELGLHVKLPGAIEPDPATGRLTAVFKDLPQVPVGEIAFNIWGGPKAPLKNPDTCGTYATAYSFAPHSSDPALGGQSQMTIDQGCEQGFSPTLHAGVTDPVAGRFSPFVLDLSREDGQQSLRGFELTLPRGELAKLRGVPLCPDAQAVTGGCPPDSRIGHVTIASGPGPSLLWLPQPGKSPTGIYLAGPYGDAPFSIVTAVPAQAGPFDLGVVAVRSGLTVDPEAAQAIIKADPLPQFIEGVATTYRRIHAVIDRHKFTLNPTNCREMMVNAEVFSNQGAISIATSRFQVDRCRALGFKPKLSLRLSGGTKRGDYPALTAILNARRGDANLGKVSVALPPSEFLAQEHIVTICTRKRFAANNCPKGSIYGKAKAWTPLLAKPLEGSVYLRSSDNPLPDLVMDLRGELQITVAGRIDSKDGGIRTTFASVPDAPITRFVLKMKGGSKGLLTNSTNICRAKYRASVVMRAQNGRRVAAEPVLEAPCGKVQKGG